MDGSSSAREPHQVSRITCGFADPTSGTVARSHSSLDRPRFDLPGVCRLRNDVVDVPRELLKMICELQEHGRVESAAVQINFLWHQQAVRSADLADDRSHEALLGVGHDCHTLTAIARVCSGDGSCSEFSIGMPIFASRRSPLFG